MFALSTTDLLHESDPFPEEVRCFLHTALDDIAFFRKLLANVTGAEHERFDEVGFSYGDTSYIGGDPYEVCESHLDTVIHTLFGGRYIAEMSLFSYEDADYLFEYLYALDGGETIFEGEVQFPGEGEAALVVELRSPTTEDIRRLIRALEISHQGMAPYRLYRWQQNVFGPDSLAETARSPIRPTDAQSRDPHDHFLMIFADDMFDPREYLHNRVFERLLGAWRALPAVDLHSDADSTAAPCTAENVPQTEEVRQ